MKRAFMITVVLALFAGACEEDKPPPPPAPTAKPSATSAELTDEQLDKEPIPVEEDFLADAEQQITEDNLDDAVAELEKEIGGEDTEPASDKPGDKDEPNEDSFD